jgi:transposase-like protein
MKKESNQKKTKTVVKRYSMKVCPHCGSDNFKKKEKEGFSLLGLLGEQFVCAKCGKTFKKAILERAKTTTVQVDKKSSAAGPGGRKHGGRKHGRR